MNTAVKPDQKHDEVKPGAIAIARDQAGGDLRAAVLLYRIKYFFDPEKKIKKLKRDGREWIAKPRHVWAYEAGLTQSEMVNYALPKLKERSFLTIRAMRLIPTGPKLLWISLDLVEMHKSTTPSDMLPYFPPGEKVIGSPAGPAYHYAKIRPNRRWQKPPIFDNL